jgi:hypothetical protein
VRFRFQHKWLRFSLRSALIAVTLACAWLGWQSHLVHERKALRQWLAWRDVPLNQVLFLPNPGMQMAPHLAAISWIRRAMGDEGVADIELPIDVPTDDARRVASSFPEAAVHQFGGGAAVEFQLTDDEYAKLKQRRVIRSERVGKLHGLLVDGDEPPMAGLMALAPWILDDLVENESNGLRGGFICASLTVECLASTCDLRGYLGPRGAPADPSSRFAEFAKNLRMLKVVLAEKPPSQGAGQLALDFGERLLEFELERCAAELAHLNRDASAEGEALARAVAAAVRLRAAADKAWRQNAIALPALTGALRRQSHAKAAKARFDNDAEGERRALLEYGASLDEYRPQIEALYQQGTPGGEAEKFHHIGYCTAEFDASIAAMHGDRDAAIAAWRRASEQADWALKATRNAFDAMTVPVDELVEAINAQAKARLELAGFSGDEQSALSARREQARQLFELARKTVAIFVMGHGSQLNLDFVACHYILARVQGEPPAEAAGSPTPEK